MGIVLIILKGLRRYAVVYVTRPTLILLDDAASQPLQRTNYVLVHLSKARSCQPCRRTGILCAKFWFGTSCIVVVAICCRSGSWDRFLLAARCGQEPVRTVWGGIGGLAVDYYLRASAARWNMTFKLSRVKAHYQTYL